MNFKIYSPEKIEKAHATFPVIMCFRAFYYFGRCIQLYYPLCTNGRFFVMNGRFRENTPALRYQRNPLKKLPLIRLYRSIRFVCCSLRLSYSFIPAFLSLSDPDDCFWLFPLLPTIFPFLTVAERVSSFFSIFRFFDAAPCCLSIRPRCLRMIHWIILIGFAVAAVRIPLCTQKRMPYRHPFSCAQA